MSAVTGSRVRCTLGESVLVGTVHRVNELCTDVVVDGTASIYSLINNWHVEVIAPALPPEPPVGSVVRCGDGQVWERHSPVGDRSWTRNGAWSSWEWLATREPVLLIPATQVIADVRDLDEGEGWQGTHDMSAELAAKYGVEA